MLRDLLRNTVFANLTYLLVLTIGGMTYQMLPRQQDPTINFNWIAINTVLPGAAALDVEQKVTDPLEDAIRTLSDVKFTSSNSREAVSSILVRFRDLDQRTFDKRVADLRREVQNVRDQLPKDADDPIIIEITSSNAYPSATVAIVGQADDETLRIQARNIEKALERLPEVDRVDAIGLANPELQVNFTPAALEALNLSPNQVANTVTGFFQDLAAGTLRSGGIPHRSKTGVEIPATGLEGQDWLVRLVGSNSDPGILAQRPIIGAAGEVILGQVAEVVRGREKPSKLASYAGQSAVVLAVMKKENANTITLVERVTAYVAERNALASQTGVKLVLIDDQTIPTREAIELMESNAVMGLLLVLGVAWIFLGWRISFLVTISIPLILAATFAILYSIGETLNVTSLLGVVIVLGMLVDDGVVIVETIYHRLLQGEDAMDACINGLQEVAAPVASSSLTTMAAFGPLMLLPGILGDFMRVIPLIVCIALTISLIEAFWMLPVHMLVMKVNTNDTSFIQRYRTAFTRWLQHRYSHMLIAALRHPRKILFWVILLMLGSAAVVALGMIRVDFFAADPLRIFYVNLEMPAATPIEATLAKTQEVEQIVRAQLQPGEARAVVSYAGNMFTEVEPRLGDHYGQVMIGLNPKRQDMRDIDTIIAAMRPLVTKVTGPVLVSFLRLAGGPPTAKPISVKVRGDDYTELRAAADAIKEILTHLPDVTDIEDDAAKGRPELVLRLDNDAVNRVGLHPLEVSQALHLLVDGQIAAEMREQGEKLTVRVRRKPLPYSDLNELLAVRLPTPSGHGVALETLLQQERGAGLGNIRHYNFRRAITVEAEIRAGGIDTVTANSHIVSEWAKLQTRFPDLDLDFSGELDDIQESLDAIGLLFVFGVGAIYLILGAQFMSYWQPFLILTTVPMAFTGVVIGLLVTNNPLSLYTMYGIVALAGVAVNSAIVLIDAMNQRRAAGMSLLHATVYASRRRLIPVLITSLTTIAGLFSLAVGMGGKSLIWGPMAASITWGLGFSTVLTLLVIPLLYRLFMR